MANPDGDAINSWIVWNAETSCVSSAPTGNARAKWFKQTPPKQNTATQCSILEILP